MKTKTWYYFVLTICVAWLIIIFYQNELPVDVGDGLMHFYISQASWTNPSLFLDHWGKPLFILLSSPFAQFGFTGMFVFNLTVFCVICHIAYKIFVKLQVNLLYASIFPFTILIASDFTTTVLGSLTEPLFNLFVILAAWFLLEKKWISFAIIVSLCPFLRSEGQLVFLLGTALLLFYKQWKVLPFLFLFPFFYFLAGILVYDDFWWYFTKSAYSFENDIYGHGPWYHYLISHEFYLGKMAYYLVLISVVVIFYLVLKKDWLKLKFPLLFFSSGIFFGIIIFHSYLWANGKYGALGLTRIATQGMPLFVVLSIYYSERIFSELHSNFKKIASLVLILFCCIKLYCLPAFPNKMPPFEKQMVLTGNFLNKQKNKLKKIHYHHPLIPFKMGYNPFRDLNKINFYYAYNIENDFDQTIKKGDLLVWDSQFGPLESGMPLAKILGLKQLSMVNDFTFKNAENKITGAYIFQYEDLPLPITKSFKIPLSKYQFENKEEFVDVYLPKMTSKQINYTVELNKKDENEIYLVCTNENNQHYQCKALTKGVNKLEYSLLSHSKYKFYIWNPKKAQFGIQINSFEEIKVVFPKIKVY